jgi:hypothetical protein
VETRRKGFTSVGIVGTFVEVGLSGTEIRIETNVMFKDFEI